MIVYKILRHYQITKHQHKERIVVYWNGIKQNVHCKGCRTHTFIVMFADINTGKLLLQCAICINLGKSIFNFGKPL